MQKIEVDKSNSYICKRCGIAYGQLKGFFPVSYGSLYKGAGFLPYCKRCVEDMYNIYLKESGDPKPAVRQVCRKLDLYWNDKIFDAAMRQNTSRTIMTTYITKINTSYYVGKCYDDTLKKEGTMWVWPDPNGGFKDVDGNSVQVARPSASDDAVSNVSTYVPSESVIAFWGPGYTAEMYEELEQRFNYYKAQLPEDFQYDMSTEALLRQIAMTEIDINKSRAEGRSVDKMANTLNTLLATLQKQKSGPSVDASGTSTPFGVWIKKWEDQRPIPDVDPEFDDIDHIVKYISIWFLGHLCKMLGIKNTYCKLYEDEIAKMRVERPEYAEEDDETMFNDIFGDSEKDDCADNMKEGTDEGGK